MSIALNKTSLKQQRDQAKTYRQYLPSLELKRQQLLAALNQASAERDEIRREQESNEKRLASLFPLLGSSTIDQQQILSLVRVGEITIEEENVVGTRLPVMRAFHCHTADYSKLVAPFWVDSLVGSLERSARLHVQMQVADRRVRRLEVAVRKITQRVNLFEKVLIPKAEENIRKIRIYLSDQERAAVVRSKLAKGKK